MSALYPVASAGAELAKRADCQARSFLRCAHAASASRAPRMLRMLASRQTENSVASTVSGDASKRPRCCSEAYMRQRDGHEGHGEVGQGRQFACLLATNLDDCMRSAAAVSSSTGSSSCSPLHRIRS